MRLERMTSSRLIFSAMKLLWESWDEVTSETIHNCWRHVGITHSNDEEWEDIFVNPDTLGSDSDVEMNWETGLDAVMKDKVDSEAAVKAVKAIMPRFPLTEPQENPPPLSQYAKSKQLNQAEKEFMDSVEALKAWNYIHGEIPAVDDFLGPAVECKDADSVETDNFKSGDKGLEEIARYIQKKQNSESNDDEEEEEAGLGFDLDLGKALEVAKLLELICVNHGDLECLLDLGRNKRQERIKLELINSSFTTWNICHMECKNACPWDIPYEVFESEGIKKEGVQPGVYRQETCRYVYHNLRTRSYTASFEKSGYEYYMSEILIVQALNHTNGKSLADGPWAGLLPF
ncbi:hypothetical protein BT96DRAFT_945360 [Gymnopus androsaceus JB14]|uniref:Uncharacterized protein n=1 Tax=Gymnopus androsaceus JB14 TaxID=1447944 RepID=A0A6A4GZR0_9AGAR|nr:hypothetical protein BT96DRAFT_945360 [Gymnopus androsaceus JB14]